MSYNDSIWSTVTTMTQKMLNYARIDDWAEVAKVESQRQVLLKQCFDGDIPLFALAKVRNNIKKIMGVDTEISGLCTKKRDAIAVDMDSHRHSRKACQSYQQCG